MLDVDNRSVLVVLCEHLRSIQIGRYRELPPNTPLAPSFRQIRHALHRELWHLARRVPKGVTGILDFDHFQTPSVHYSGNYRSDLPVASLSTRPRKPLDWGKKKTPSKGRCLRGFSQSSDPTTSSIQLGLRPTGASIRIGLEDRFDRLDQSGEDLVRIGLGVGTTVFEVALVA